MVLKLFKNQKQIMFLIWALKYFLFKEWSWDYTGSLQTKANSWVSKGWIQYKFKCGSLVSSHELGEVRKRITAVLEIFVMWRRCADTFSPKNASCVVVPHFTLPSATNGPKRYLRASHESTSCRCTTSRVPTLLNCCVVCPLITIF